MIWSAANVDEFHRRFVVEPIVAKGQDFLAKLKVQLHGAPDQVIDLAAEIVFVYYLVDMATSGEKKRENINGILAFASSPIAIPAALDSALDHGLLHPGTAFNTLRFQQLSFLTEFLRKWKSGLTESERRAALRDPWQFKSVVFSLPPKGAQTMREALLHLAFPDTFEAITSETHKKRITEALKSLVPGPETDRDRILLSLREKLGGADPRFDFYRKDVRPRWDLDAEAKPLEAAWFVTQSADSEYADIEGIAYEYRTNLPNAQKIKEGHVLVTYALGPKRVIGLGRVGDIRSRGTGRVAAVYDRYAHLKSPATLDDIGGDPRPNPQFALWPLPPAVVEILLEREGLSSIADAPAVEAPELPDPPPITRPIHVVLKWNADREPLTIERHREIALREGSVWWGRFARAGGPGVAAAKIRDLRYQLEHGIVTQAFLYRKGNVWKARLQEVTTDPADVDDKLLPQYYAKEECNAFFRLSDFGPVEQSWLEGHLRLASNRDSPTALPGALGNQTTPLFVHLTTEPTLTPTPKAAADLTMEWLVRETLWARADIEDLVESLTGAREREDVTGESLRTAHRAAILAGPPGTGKTWVADHLAMYLTQNEALASRTVQFHPSYGYEEFIEGLRPLEGSQGQLTFKRVDGIVLEMAAQISREDQLHVLLIDEMNRANLPKVFGELMYALEYRDKPVDLLYTDDFTLPHNLLFLATMNTADRSIRSIDIALRRRFEVFECLPNRGILERYYEFHVNQVPDLIEGFDRLNEMLVQKLDRHHTIGHTFFMADPMHPKRLRGTWARQLSPLIEDYFFDQPDVLAEFKLSTFWPSLNADSLPQGV